MIDALLISGAAYLLVGAFFTFLEGWFYFQIGAGAIAAAPLLITWPFAVFGRRYER